MTIFYHDISWYCIIIQYHGEQYHGMVINIMVNNIIVWYSQIPWYYTMVKYHTMVFYRGIPYHGFLPWYTHLPYHTMVSYLPYHTMVFYHGILQVCVVARLTFSLWSFGRLGVHAFLFSLTIPYHTKVPLICISYHTWESYILVTRT